MIKLNCDYCNKEIFKPPSHLHKHNFCSKDCLSNFSNKNKNPDKYKNLKNYKNISLNFTNLNYKLNKFRMTPEVKEKISNSKRKNRNLDLNTTYFKKNGVHEHRTIMEEIIGRKLREGEIVHHIDGNRHNNSKENLMLFSSQSEHIKYHNKVKKEVM